MWRYFVCWYKRNIYQHFQQFEYWKKKRDKETVNIIHFSFKLPIQEPLSHVTIVQGDIPNVWDKQF